MIYKITMMSGQKIVLENEDALKSFLGEANSGKKLILTKFGVVNVASVDSIVPDWEKMNEITAQMRMGQKEETAKKEILGEGYFEKILSGNTKQLE